ncbi:MAG: TIGR02391 family protein [Anaerolineales bacterium]|nr:TIGR02391 family protein [Anaerolineales bacterium]
MTGRELRMTFDPNTIEHLGVRMYSTLPPVLAELIGNSYDADAKRVDLILDDSGAEKEIVIIDNGSGMSFDDINAKFLRIGRNRREIEGSEITVGGRKVIGKKGLGKLAFFGIAHEIEISTRKDGKENSFIMRWEDIKNSGSDYKPHPINQDVPCSPEEHGTRITLRRIQRKTDFHAKDLASSLAKMFILDSDFEIHVSHNGSEAIAVTNELRYTALEKEIEWDIPKDVTFPSEYSKADQITGHLMTTKKPIPPHTNMRGVVLFSRKKLVNLPEYFSDSTSSHFFSYLTGWLEVNFIDELEDDVIATNRQSLNWGHEDMQELRRYLRTMMNTLERDWRKKRTEARERELTKVTGIDVPNWFSKLPPDIRANVEPLVSAIVRDSELSAETHQAAIRRIYSIVPEYPKYHWRHLHEEIKSASQTDYQRGDYYRAFQEAVKRYISGVKERSESTNRSDVSMMGEVFGNGQAGSTSIWVGRGYTKPSGSAFAATTIENIEEGQKHLSMGVVSGCRNPVSHEEISDLRDSGLFTEKDCLDALSLLSHLFSRLDNFQKAS